MATRHRSQTAIGAAAFIGMIVSSPALLSVNPLLLTPTTTEFGWGRAVISSAYLVAAPVTALLYVLVGRLLDRFGARRVLIPGYVLCGSATALLSQLDGSVAQLLLLKTLASACATLPTGVAVGKVVSRHFTTNRGAMLGLCLGAGGGLGMTLMPIVGAHLLETFGWRGTYVGIGAIAMLIGVPAALFLPDDSPARRDPAEDATAMPAPALPGLALAPALRTRAAWILLVTALLACLVLNGTLAHLAAIMTDSRLNGQQAALALSIYAMAMMAAQFGIGFLLDRYNSPRIGIPVFIVVLSGVALLHVGGGMPTLYLGALLVGAGAGSEYGILPYMITRFFGLRSFGSLYGLVYATAAIGTGIGPFAMGLAFDAAHSYAWALTLFEVVVATIIVLLLRLPPYVYAADGSLMMPDRPAGGADRPLAMATAPPPRPAS